MSIRDKIVILFIKLFLKNNYNFIEFFLMCFIFIDLLLLIIYLVIQDIDIQFSNNNVKLRKKYF